MTTTSQDLLPLRLLIDGHTFDVGPQGTTTFLAGLVNAMPAAAAELGLPPPQILCACSDPLAANRFLHIPFQHLPIRSGFLARNSIDLPRLSATLRPTATISQYVRPFKLTGRSVSVIHDVLFLDYPELFSWFYRASRHILFGWSARQSDTIFTVSEYSRQRIAHWYGIDASVVHVVPNGVPVSDYEVSDDEDCNLEDQEGTNLRLIYVSRLEQRKRQDWCIQATEILRQSGRNVSLDLIGNGSGAYADDIRRQVGESVARGIPVVLHENISDGALSRLLGAADVALFPSRCEGFGIPVIEASARGVPCVVANNTALRELRPWYVGSSFVNDSFADFLKKITETLDARDRLRREARNLAPTVRRSFAWSAIARTFLIALLKDLAR